jgi:hypothetical protein
VLLVELIRRGIEIRADDDCLRYRPRSAMTPDLADRLNAHRAELLAILAAADRRPAGDAGSYTARERRLLAGCPEATLAAVDAAKRAFGQVGGVTVEAVVPFKSEARDAAARLIREARRGGDVGRAVALRDAWRQRLAICTIDGGLSERDAERVALDELGLILAKRQG